MLCQKPLFGSNDFFEDAICAFGAFPTTFQKNSKTCPEKPAIGNSSWMRYHKLFSDTFGGGSEFFLSKLKSVAT